MSRIDPLERLSRAAEEAIDGDDPRVATFARGLAIGALVGAAIAGSTLWQRRRRSVPPAVESPVADNDPLDVTNAADARPG